MDEHTGRAYWDRTGLYRLLAAVLIGGAAWAITLEAGYALVKPACRADRILWLTAVNAVGLTGAAIGLWLARSALTELKDAAVEQGPTPIDRSYFMALSAIGLNAMFALLILLSTVPQLLRLPCE
jgi:hypothetical protein